MGRLDKVLKRVAKCVAESVRRLLFLGICTIFLDVSRKIVANYSHLSNILDCPSLAQGGLSRCEIDDPSMVSHPLPARGSRSAVMLRAHHRTDPSMQSGGSDSQRTVPTRSASNLSDAEAIRIVNSLVKKRPVRLSILRWLLYTHTLEVEPFPDAYWRP